MSISHPTHIVSHTPTVEGTVAAGVAGALITGSMAAAREARETGTSKEKRAEFARNVAKESITGGIAVAVGVTVAKTLFRSNLLGLIAMAAVSAGTKYAIDECIAKKGPGLKDAASKAADKVGTAAGKAADKVSGAVKDLGKSFHSEKADAAQEAPAPKNAKTAKSK